LVSPSTFKFESVHTSTGRINQLKKEMSVSRSISSVQGEYGFK
jgi:hypothetical protein